jgi:hypothetical protein
MERNDEMVFKAERMVKHYTMNLCAPPAEVFPLLCPVREYEWIEPWSCDMVFSTSGVAENNAVFTTDFSAQGGHEIWVVSRFEKDRAIQFVRFTPGLKVNRLDIALASAGEGTRIEWTHTYTGLSEAGNQWIREMTDDTFRTEKVAIETMLNHYLKTGTMLTWADLHPEADPYGHNQSN